ncbi:hypothetical protein EV401DRAFT_1844089 [Pisolithus croceorrhizus]|nr:hypothetical protein EV401DRAFT_1844089 [Pisolithus croceorrhizus]
MPWSDLVRPTQSTVVSSLYAHKMLLYALVSSVAVITTIANALKRHSNFYSLTIYLSKSNRSVLILANFGLLFALLCGRAAQCIFFGALRPQEIERLYDRLWFFVTESLLAFTIFRDDFDIPFVLMFGFLLFIKSFHWLASDRIEWMDQRPYPGPPTQFHIRMGSLMFLLWSIDVSMFAFAVESTTKNGVSGVMMFASEYAILMASALNITAKYLICVMDLRRARQRGGENAPPWQNKSMWVFYVELVTDFLKLSTYLVFFMLIVAFYGLPLNIIRDVYLTGKSFISRLRALFRYRAATRNMEERYPDATEQEMLVLTDRTCIICREEMLIRGNSGEDGSSASPASYDGPNTTPKKLPCGHIFHFYCLRSWLERQQSCPTCRRSVLENITQDQNRTQQAPPPPPQPQPAARQPNEPGFPAAQFPQRDNNGPAGILGRWNRARQPPAGPNVGQQNLPTVQGWLPGHVPGVIIQYNIQYQTGPHPQGQPRLPTSTVSSQAVPPFTGFAGPNGSWCHWELDRRWLNQDVARSRTGAGSASTSTSHPPVEHPSEVEGSGVSTDAAAPPVPGLSSHASTSQSDFTPIPPTLPSLIPLEPFHLPASPSASRTDQGSPQSGAMPAPEESQAAPEAIVSDEQLILMDRLSREAIDERLRILGNVSRTIDRCVEDLMRVRSALPATTVVSHPTYNNADPGLRKLHRV